MDADEAQAPACGEFRVRSNLVVGDCRQELRHIQDQAVDAILTSPPYWGIRDYNGECAIGFEEDLGCYLTALRDVLVELLRCLRNDGVMWLVVGDCFTSGNRSYRAPDRRVSVRAQSQRPKTPIGMKAKDLVGLPWKVAELARSVGWYLRAEIVWMKPNPLPESVKDRPSRGHELIFLLSKAKKYRFFKHKLIDRLRANQQLLSPSVWRFQIGADRAMHCAPFPLSLADACLASCAEAGHTILDPFCGSGTVGVSALGYSCNFIGIDVDQAAIENCTVRIRKRAVKLAVESSIERGLPDSH